MDILMAIHESGAGSVVRKSDRLYKSAAKSCRATAIVPHFDCKSTAP